MYNLKRIGIFLLAAAVVVAFSVSYRGGDIQKRAVILGLGIDVHDEGILLTAEVVNPGNGSEQAGTFGKIVSASGETVVEALQGIAEKTGKETSLGQCVLIAFGEEFAATDFSDALEYFAMSDSVRENSAVCCVKGTAYDFFSVCDALEQSVSLSVADKLNGRFEEISLPSCDLLTFYRGQNELYRTGFLSYVYFENSSNTDQQSADKEQVYFCCDSVAVLKQNKLVGLLDEQETQGFALLKKGVSGTLLPVTEEDGSVITLRANSKKVEIAADKNGVSIKLKVAVKLARADSFGAGSNLTAKSEKEISDSALMLYKQKAQDLIVLFLQKQSDWEVDLLQIHELLRQKYGAESAVVPSMAELPVQLTVEVEES